ncbi:MAG: hypothetical protein IIC62_06120 [Proteobacteria bacterium]|nr:hypothetical protein [Pseudomonadota bacterium]
MHRLDEEIRMLNYRIWVLATALSACLVAAPAQSQDLGKAINSCASITDDGARLTCYDALAAMMGDVPVAEAANAPAAENAPAAATAAVVVAATTAPLTDDIGKERLEPKDPDEQPRYASHVTSCKESIKSGQYFFTMENGQVWKQSNYRQLAFKNCDFDVEISKGTFGYQMYIPSKDRSVRVARVR